MKKKIYGLLSVFCMIFAPNLVMAATLQSQIDEASNGSVITLDTSYTENITIASDKDIIIDLNGQTLTSEMVVNGALTVRDSGTTGKIVSTNNVEVHGLDSAAYFTLESGTIEVANDYGLYTDNAVVKVLGGTVSSKYAALSGNNTKGAMTFVVSGGTIEAAMGPAIYMPGPISLDVTGGKILGGISLRMGKVNISGGVITAINDYIDMPTDTISGEPAYAYSGNVWFPDALYVIGGTYTTKIEGETNILDLKITGGEFESFNGKGSAIGIYDLGKVEQSMNVSISGSAILNTNSDTRTAYQVVDFKDLGVTPISGFGNASYIGKINTSLTGGIYSNDVSEYVESGYLAKLLVDEYYVYKINKVNIGSVTAGTVEVDKTEATKGDVIKLTLKPNEGYSLSSVKILDASGNEVEFIPSDNTFSMPDSEVTISVVYGLNKVEADAPVINTEEPVKEVTAGVTESAKVEEVLLDTISKDDKILAEIDGKDSVVKVTVENVEVKEEVATKVKEVLNKKATNVTIVDYLDINIAVKEKGTDTLLAPITELSSPIEFTVLLPETIEAVKTGYTRTYYIVRHHEGAVEILDAKLSEDGKTLSFSTDKFSEYAIAYSDSEVTSSTDTPTTTPETPETPKTSDNILVYVSLGFVGIAAIGYSLYNLKKRNSR